MVPCISCFTGVKGRQDGRHRDSNSSSRRRQGRVFSEAPLALHGKPVSDSVLTGVWRAGARPLKSLHCYEQDLVQDTKVYKVGQQWPPQSQMQKSAKHLSLCLRSEGSSQRPGAPGSVQSLATPGG